MFQGIPEHQWRQKSIKNKNQRRKHFSRALMAPLCGSASVFLFSLFSAHLRGEDSPTPTWLIASLASLSGPQSQGRALIGCCGSGDQPYSNPLGRECLHVVQIWRLEACSQRTRGLSWRRCFSCLLTHHPRSSWGINLSLPVLSAFRL